MSDIADSTRKLEDEAASIVIVTPAGSTSDESELKEANGAPETKSKRETAAIVFRISRIDSVLDDGETEDKVIKTGHLTETKDLFAKYDKEGNRSWTDKHPDDIDEAAENAQTLKYAVIVRKSKSLWCASRESIANMEQQRSPRRPTPASLWSLTALSFNHLS